MKKRVIVAAALQYENGCIIVGVRHFDVIMHNQLEWMTDSYNWDIPEQGFIDNKGIFVNREKALDIAREADQLINQKADEILFSEDLY